LDKRGEWVDGSGDRFYYFVGLEGKVSNVAQGVSWYAIRHPGVRFRSDAFVTASLAAWTSGYPPLLTAYSLTNLARVLLTDRGIW
jgi:hypothetical protein